MTAFKITYDMTDCSRCGGSGHFSYNSLTGTTCFKCNGGKRQVTARGRKAQKIVRGLRSELTEVNAEDVEVGDRVRLSHSRRYFTVEDVIVRPNSRRSNGGPWEDTISLVSPRESVGLSRDMVVERIPTTDQWQQIIDLANDTPGANVVAK